jgi:hypothetical protein
MIEIGRADRAQQHGISDYTGVKRSGRQWRAPTLDRHTTGVVFCELKVVAVDVCDLLQNTHGLFSNFRANAISRKDYDFQLHSFWSAATFRSFSFGFKWKAVTSHRTPNLRGHGPRPLIPFSNDRCFR